jgi:hypothetical protein
MDLKVNFDWDYPHGSGKFLWAIISVDEDDSEDSNVSLWRADSEEHLYDQVKADWVGDDDEYDIAEDFEESWNYKIIPKRLGEIL